MIMLLQQLFHEHEQFDIILDNQEGVGILVSLVLRQVFKRVLLLGGLYVRLQVDDVAMRMFRVDLVALVNLGTGEGILLDGQFDDEGSTLSLETLTLDGASVEVDQVMGQGETDTRAEGGVLTVFSVVETGEEPLHLLMGNTGTIVTHPYDNLVITGIGGDIDNDFSFLTSIFRGIRQEVEDNLVEFVGVNPSHHTLRLTTDGKLQAFLSHEGLDTQGGLPDITHHIPMTDTESQFSCL